jgi:hypothetical protein
MKYILTFLLLLSLYNDSNAQVRFKKSIIVGGNFNTARVKNNAGNILYKSNYVPGFHVGILLNTNVEGKLNFTTGLMGVAKGFKTNFNRADTVSLQANYFSIEVPFLAQINFKEGNVNTGYVTFGPSLGFNLSGKTKLVKTSGTVNSDMVWGFQDFGRYEGSIHTAIGYKTAKGFFIEARYLLGLGNIWNRDEGDVIRYRAPMLSLGYTFGGKKLAFE